MGYTYKRFMVFCYDRYESQGGLDDCFNDFDAKEEAIEKALILNISYEVVEILDRIEGVYIHFK